nr:uncharacterized protein I203_06497 [Kwoniella mangroviensis CBS 8507]OCF64316.1 hypothetical protein I203_06497 [Kwoniella mangroviensis CBS 8507]
MLGSDERPSQNRHAAAFTLHCQAGLFWSLPSWWIDKIPQKHVKIFFSLRVRDSLPLDIGRTKSEEVQVTGGPKSDMSKIIGQVLVVVAVLALVHDLSTLKALSRPTGSLPASIILEALISLGLFIPGIALSSDSLEDVTYRGELAKRSIDDQDAKMAFMIPSKRGRAIFGEEQ